MNDIPTKLLWLDLEMTGLDPDKDLILEVACEVTGFDLQTTDSYEARLSQDRAQVETRFAANDFYSRDFPENREDFLKTLATSLSLEQVEKDLCEFVEKNFGREPAILAGNSIHNDRLFIKKWLPKFDKLLHYRMLDVSALKILMQGKYGVVFEKKNLHRAFDDIQASIAELEFYLDWFSKNPDKL